MARRLAQMREANAHLVVAAVRAQTLREEAETASHLKDEFLATVSHEIRTPLGAVLGWVGILESKPLPPEAERAIGAIGRNATALAHMIDDLLDTSRILNGAIRLALGPVDLAAVAQGALETVRPMAATKNVDLALGDVPGSRTVSGDAERLQQVIWNLLANAIKFTPEGGRVEVFIESATEHVEVRVVDTGQGISPDFLPHVFDRFRQGDDATTRRHTGLGLGLGIVRHLVELHGGTVQAASPGVRQGATFTVRLPIAAGASEGQAAVRADSQTESSECVARGCHSSARRREQAEIRGIPAAETREVTDVPVGRQSRGRSRKVRSKRALGQRSHDGGLGLRIAQAIEAGGVPGPAVVRGHRETS